jgi:hypothetical protein
MHTELKLKGNKSTQSAPKKLKDKQKEEEQDLRAEKNEATLKWFMDNLVCGGPHYSNGMVTLPIEYISSPEACIKARDSDSMHVDVLEQSFLEKGMLNPKIFGVMWSNVPDLASNITKENFSIDTNAAAPPRPINAAVGDHTQLAIKRLRIKKPNNKKYKQVQIQLAIVPKTPENIAKVLYLGTMDNTIEALHKPMTMWECCKQMNRQHTQIFRSTEPTKTKKEQWASYKDMAKRSMPFTGGTFNTMECVAKVDKQIWALLSAIFENNIVQNKEIKQTVPTSLTHFQHMGNIETADLVRWLTRVVNGQWNTKNFVDRCKRHKKSLKLKKDILEYVNTIRSEHEFKTYDQIASRYPQLADADWFNNVLDWTPERNEKLQSHTKTAVLTLIEKQEAIEKEQTLQVRLSVYVLAHTCHSQSD